MARSGAALQQLHSGNIVPDVVTQLAPELLDFRVNYKEIEVTNGVTLRIAQTQIRPHVEFRGTGFGGDDDLWTVLMVDPDAPSPDHPEYRSFLHWIVINVPGSAAPNQEIWQTGKEVTPYMGPAPPAGIHRYVFLLFKQKGEISIENQDRPKFNVNSFAEKWSLQPARGAVYFLAKGGDELDHPGNQS